MGKKEDTSEICISEFAKEVLNENLLDIIPDGFNLKIEIILPNGEFLAERTSNKSFGIVDGLSTLKLPNGLVKILIWYDNEYGYVHRMAELAAKISRSL